MTWWIAAGIALIAAADLVLRRLQQLRDDCLHLETGLAEIRKMNWREFEEYLGFLFRSPGYKAEITPPSGDFGVDVIAIHPDGTRIAVQAKHWRTEYVGVEHVLETVGGAAHYRCQQAIVVTTSGFSEQARARTGHAPAVPRQAVGLPAPRQDPKPPVPKPASRPARLAPRGPKPNCPECGSPMNAHTALQRPIWLCSRFPACHGYRVN